MRDVGALELLGGSLQIPELRMLMSCACANEHESTNVGSGEDGFKMGINLPCNRGGDMLDHD